MNDRKKIAVGKTVMRQMKPMAGTIIDRGQFGNLRSWLVRWKNCKVEWFDEDTVRRMLLE